MPNFLIIGAAKSGTTSLYEYLNQHPEVYMSPVKEPHFFAYEGERPHFRGPRDEQWFNSKVVYDLQEYRKLFADVAGEQAIGEASTSYLNHMKAPERIKQHIPHAKLIAILRHPVDRAYSAFMMLAASGYEPYTDFAKAIREEDKRIQNGWHYGHYISRSFYYPYLKRYYELFPGSHIKVLLYEDLQQEPQRVMQELYRFLGVDGAFAPAMGKKHNVSKGVPRSALLRKLTMEQNPLKSLLKPLLPDRIRRSLREKTYTRTPMAPALRKQLLQLFREDIDNLQQLLGRDLSVWLSQ